MALLSKRNLIDRIRKGRDARRRLVASNLAKGVAFQIRNTRDARGMTQDELASLAGMSQNNLCRLEDPNYGKHTLSSLKRIADALDVALVVRFIPFSRYIDWLTATPTIDPGLTAEALAVPSFNEEEKTGMFASGVEYPDLQVPISKNLPLIWAPRHDCTTPVNKPTVMEKQFPAKWQPYMYQEELYGKETRA